jgi:hypothetical protein
MTKKKADAMERPAASITSASLLNSVSGTALAAGVD